LIDKQASHTRGNKTVKTEQFGGTSGVITTRFDYDGIQRLVKVTDTEGAETFYTFDPACRRPQATTHSLNPGQNDNYERAQFYYHPDHLGSSSFITNLDGDVAQHHTCLMSKSWMKRQGYNIITGRDIMTAGLVCGYLPTRCRRSIRILVV